MTEGIQNSEVELNGLLFKLRERSWLVEDLNYGVVVGALWLHDGPGWVLTSIMTDFLDVGQMQTIIKFVEGLSND